MIDAVGMEASAGHGQGGLLAAAKEAILPAERTFVLDQAIKDVRPGGTVSVPGYYGGPMTVNMGSIVQKSLTLVSGQTSVKRYLEPLTKLIQEKKVDTTSIISHRSTRRKDRPDLYQTSRGKKDGCTSGLPPGGLIAGGCTYAAAARLHRTRIFARNHTLMAGALAGQLVSAPAFAQNPPPSDQDFVAKAFVGNTFEVEEAKLALDKATTPGSRTSLRR